VHGKLGTRAINLRVVEVGSIHACPAQLVWHQPKNAKATTSRSGRARMTLVGDMCTVNGGFMCKTNGGQHPQQPTHCLDRT
jgi:hypothetical protein